MAGCSVDGKNETMTETKNSSKENDVWTDITELPAVGRRIGATRLVDREAGVVVYVTSNGQAGGGVGTAVIPINDTDLEVDGDAK